MRRFGLFLTLVLELCKRVTKETILKKILPKLFNTKGVNEIVVSLLLVLIGVISVMGVHTVINQNKHEIMDGTEAKVDSFIEELNTSN